MEHPTGKRNSVLEGIRNCAAHASYSGASFAGNYRPIKAKFDDTVIRHAALHVLSVFGLSPMGPSVMALTDLKMLGYLMRAVKISFYYRGGSD